MRSLALAFLALVLVAPAAAAWKPVSTVPVVNTMHPGVVRTASASELVAYGDNKSTLKVWSSATELVTTMNAAENVAIVALNRRLGFERAAVGTTASLSLADA
jgi:CHASE2 domain-containing sensor protein